VHAIVTLLATNTIFLNLNQSSKKLQDIFKQVGFFGGLQGSLGPSMTSKGS
jgi:hypothetical protein